VTTVVDASLAVPAPAWFREVGGSLGITPQFVLEGNVYDRYLLPSDRGGVRPVADLVSALWEALSAAGYEAMFCFDPTDGLRLLAAVGDEGALAGQVLGRQLAPDRNPLSLAALADDLRAIVHADRRVAIVIERGGRLVTDVAQMGPEEHDFFRAGERLALTARPAPPAGRDVGLYNSVFWVVDRDRQLPPWLVAHADEVRSIAIPLPDYGDREQLAHMLLGRLDGWAEADDDARSSFVDRFTQQTEGMTLSALFSITLLAADTGVGLAGLEDAARAYRVGILDNPWRTAHLRDRLASGEEHIGERVLGQRDAIRKALDITVRSATGLTGAHGSPYGTRPRGVLFFAGPTGVGKTELAKQLTELIFGDERAYIRFDMSEFSEEHTAARLIGAPPGYTGYDTGGELTNAMRQRPFSLVLFDEIEKAHGRILDKFLQVLEDGRLTDGRGATVFFSEAVIVFTSNLGVWVEGPDGQRVPNVTRDDDRDDAERKILAAIKDHFTAVLGRPELLNRLGDNIVVFDFIDRETGERILDLLVRNVAARVEREHGSTLILEPQARAQLAEAALANLDNGGRGIGSVVENALVNPLAREVFARGAAEDGVVEPLRVTAIRREGRTFELDLA
jgi:ATP-dependent Clp protease ATP-binding subunit ClpB